MLPRVKIYYENGSIGATTPIDDGTCGLIASGVAVRAGFDDESVEFELERAYLITKLSDLQPLGITDAANDPNANIYNAVKEFYNEAPEGTKLWLMGVARTVTYHDMLDKTKSYAAKLIREANGTINFLFTSKVFPGGYTPTIVNGLDNTVTSAMFNAQLLAEWATYSLYAPLFVILEGLYYNGTPGHLANLSEYSYNRVGVVIGSTRAGSVGSSTGLLAGRLAAIPVQRSITRVKSGPIKAEKLYIRNSLAELANPDLINDAGYICPRTFVGMAGYYWANDHLATADTDDYKLIQRRRVIDKAYRIAYKTLSEELGDEIPVTNQGYIPAPIVKSIQNRVETAIENRMTAYGNLGVDPSDPKDTGVTCYIDHTQNVLATSRLNVQLRVKPFGYPKYIDVYLGFKTVNT